MAKKLRELSEVREARYLGGGGAQLPLLIFGDLSGLNGVMRTSKKKKVSGAGARLCAAIEDERAKCDLEPLVLFTGNSFGSTFEGTVTAGDHAVRRYLGLHITRGGGFDQHPDFPGTLAKS